MQESSKASINIAPMKAQRTNFEPSLDKKSKEVDFSDHKLKLARTSQELKNQCNNLIRSISTSPFSQKPRGSSTMRYDASPMYAPKKG
jgi:hypothetical protein